MRRPLRWLAALSLLFCLAVAPVAKAENVLRVGTGGAFTSLDPHYHNLVPNNTLADYIFGAIISLDGQFKPVPNFAESWRVVDDHTWEFKLRPGLKFSDGTPLTPDDIIFSYARIPTILNSPSSFNQAVNPIERIEVVDPLTLRMHTKEPQPLLPYYLASARIVSKHAAEGATTADFNSGKAAIGAGPYKVEQIVLGDRVVLVRNENYWGPRPYWDRVIYRLIANDAARTAAMLSGDVDIIDQVSTRDVATLRSNPNLVIRSPAGIRLIYLYMDTEREPTPQATDANGQRLARNPLRDVRVRRALSLAINREGIRTQIMDGFAVPSGQIMPEGAVGYTPDLRPDPYDPARARALLAEAGYPQGFGLTLNGPNDRYVNDRPIEEAVAQMWTRIGVKTTVASVPSSVFFAGRVRDEYTVELAGWASDTGEASSNLLNFFASSNPEKGRGTVLRRSHFGRPEIDAVIEKSLATFDPEERERLYIEATKMAMAEQAIIPLHFQVNIFAMRKGIDLDHPAALPGQHLRHAQGHRPAAAHAGGHPRLGGQPRSLRLIPVSVDSSLRGAQRRSNPTKARSELRWIASLRSQ
jgi:peptide/nickel transport system substrate-binding protein